MAGRRTEDSQLLSSQPNSPSARQTPGRSQTTSTTSSFVPSPLNPTSSVISSSSQPFANPRSRQGSRADVSATFRDGVPPPIPSSFPTHSMIGMGLGVPTGSRGSMILYRLASDDDKEKDSITTRESHHHLLPPKLPRESTLMSSKSSFISMELESKYGGVSHRDSAFPTARGGLVPYEYDPALDEMDPVDEEDLLHDPAKGKTRKNSFPWRGIMNVAVLLTLTFGLLVLFVFYPVFIYFHNQQRNNLIDGNIRINATGTSTLSFRASPPSLITLVISFRPGSCTFPDAGPNRHGHPPRRTNTHRFRRATLRACLF